MRQARVKRMKASIAMSGDPSDDQLKIPGVLKRFSEEELARHRARPKPDDAELLRQIREMTQKLNALEREVMARSAPQPRLRLRTTAPAKTTQRRSKTPDDAALSDRALRSVPLWSKRKDNSLSPAAFIRTHYAGWLGKGLTRAHIRRRDLPLYRAFAVWVHRHPDDDIAELPQRRTDVDDKLDRLSRDMDPDEIRKLGLALQSRRRRDVK